MTNMIILIDWNNLTLKVWISIQAYESYKNINIMNLRMRIETNMTLLETFSSYDLYTTQITISLLGSSKINCWLL